MYHIADDKRQQATAEKISNGLRSCLSVRNLTEITVSDICKAAGVSRSSFYRSFDMPLDVLSYACDKVVDMIIKDFSSTELTDSDDLVRFSLRYWRNHSDILEAAVNCDRMDIIGKAIENHSNKLVRNLLIMVHNDFTKAEVEYIQMGIVGLISNLLVVWIRHGEKESPDQLYELYVKCRKVILGLHQNPIPVLTGSVSAN